MYTRLIFCPATAFTEKKKKKRVKVQSAACHYAEKKKKNKKKTTCENNKLDIIIRLNFTTNFDRCAMLIVRNCLTKNFEL